jgi:NADH:ubiquinone oxidoreductase subunit 5 (subunit L)/multisubunit Na+/H+ antiporter MnhA subunit
MNAKLILFLIIFVPVLGAFILPLLGLISKNLRNITALILVSVSVIFSFIALPNAVKGMPLHFNINFPIDFNFGLLGDGLAVFMAIVSAFIGAVIVFYSFGYISHYKNQNEYYLMVVLFIGSMMGIVYSTNLIFLFVFWEISSICSWRLIGFFREKEYVLKADKAFLVTVFGALVMLIGFIIIYFQTGTFELTKMKGTVIPDLAVLLILFGIFSKSATLPLHTWLPDAGVAPSPVTSLLHAAVLVKIGVYVFARLFLVTFEVSYIWHTIIPIVAAASALVSAGAAIIETDLKRLIAYSTVSQIAFIFLGLSTGSIIGATGALLYILMHGLAKGGLFLCAGIVEQNTKTKDITKLGGLISTMPITAVTFAICAFSVMGIPPLGGFFSKLLVIRGAVDASEPWIALTFVIGAVLTIIYMLRVFVMVFLGENKFPDIREGSFTMIFSVIVLAALSILGGIFINIPADFVNTISKQMEVIYK